MKKVKTEADIKGVVVPEDKKPEPKADLVPNVDLIGQIISAINQREAGTVDNAIRSQGMLIVETLNSVVNAQKKMATPNIERLIDEIAKLTTSIESRPKEWTSDVKRNYTGLVDKVIIKVSG